MATQIWLEWWRAACTACSRLLIKIADGLKSLKSWPRDWIKMKITRKERIMGLKNKGRQGFIDLGCNLHSRGGLLRWCAIFVTGSSFHLFYGLSTQTPSADADRLCGSLRWTTTSKDNSLHDEEEKAKEQQFKTDKFWPMPILYQYSPHSYFWSPPL